jgi:hypothetical protein
MPFTLISHQAPSLLIKTKFPRKIDGIAICIGSIQGFRGENGLSSNL